MYSLLDGSSKKAQHAMCSAKEGIRGGVSFVLQFYAMVNFCNPGVLGSPSEFRKHFESPILQGREPDSTADEAQLGLDRSSELSQIVNDFILRRTNALLSAHLPPKAHIHPAFRAPPRLTLPWALTLSVYCAWQAELNLVLARILSDC